MARRYLERQIGGLVLGYLAMVAEFGYIIALMNSGLLMREQFFGPHKFHHSLALRHQMLLVQCPWHPTSGFGQLQFSFTFENGGCFVGARNYAVIVPVSRDPRLPIARHLQIVPWKYKLRPDFRTVFD